MTIDIAAHQLAGATFRVATRVCLEPTGTARTVRVHVAHALDHWPLSCQDYVRMGLKEAKKSDDIFLRPGDCTTLIKTFEFDQTSWSAQDDMHIIAWAQDPNDAWPATVHQAALMPWPFPPDCNANGVPDPDDIATGASDDLNGNGVPDECEYVYAGVDLWMTPPGGTTAEDFMAAPIPVDFFGPGSDPFDGQITLGTLPLVTNPAGDFGPSDVVVERLDDAVLSDYPTQDTITARVAALSLQSVAPITITYNGGQNPETWDVEVVLSDQAQPTGSMTIYKQCPGGGTYDATLPVLPKFIFTRTADQAERVLDFGAAGRSPHQFATAGARWVHEVDVSLGVVRPLPGVQVDANRDGVWEPPLPGASRFVPGVWLIPCDPNSALADSEQRPRIMHHSAAGAMLGLVPTQWPAGDYDGDGLDDDTDNCWLDANPFQEDLDVDSIGDACDNCDAIYNPWQINSDADPWGDACDNCPTTTNTDQADGDGDLAGDACDPCPGTPSGHPTGTAGCSVGDMDCSNVIDFDDINPFVLALVDPPEYDAGYPHCSLDTADCDGDGEVGFSDINPFIVLLLDQ